jgi:hypothetical protein
MSDEKTPDRPEAIPVAALPDVGSGRLAEALATQDVAAIAQALRHDFVVVPIVRPADGETQNRVFAAPEGSARPYELCLFSSAHTLAAFLGDAPDREFALRRGSTLVPFLQRHADAIERVVFDPAGPHPMAATPEDVLLALEPQPGDDDVAWVTGGDGGSGPAAVVPLEGPDDDGDEPGSARPGERAVGFDVRLPEQWAVIQLDDAETRQRQVRELVRRQTKVLGDRGARLRRDMREWLERTGSEATTAGGKLLAFLLQRDEKAALALSLVLYWHHLGPEFGGPHLTHIGEKIRAGLGPDDELVGSQTAAGPFLRHSRLTRGAAELEADAYPLLVIDYWLAAPDRRGTVQLSFSTPHVDAREAITLLTDNVMLATGWVLEESPA